MAVGEKIGMKIAPSSGSINKYVLNGKLAAASGSIDKKVKGVWISNGSAWKAAPYGILGDVNMDGEVTISDYTLIRYHVEESALLTGNALLLADVNQDGVVNETDLNLVRDYIL